jgi:hypothetical protein
MLISPEISAIEAYAGALLGAAGAGDAATASYLATESATTRVGSASRSATSAVDVTLGQVLRAKLC